MTFNGFKTTKLNMMVLWPLESDTFVDGSWKLSFWIPLPLCHFFCLFIASDIINTNMTMIPSTMFVFRIKKECWLNLDPPHSDCLLHLPRSKSADLYPSTALHILLMSYRSLLVLDCPMATIKYNAVCLVTI